MNYFKTYENFDDKLWYHGSSKEFDNFLLKKGTFLDTEYINPIFLTSDIKFAKYYAGYKSPYIYVIKVLTNNIFDYRILPSGYDLVKYEDKGIKVDGYDYELGNKLYNDLCETEEDPDRRYSDILCGDYSVLEHVSFYEWLKKEGYDGSYVSETKTLNLFIFDPSKIKIVDIIK